MAAGPNRRSCHLRNGRRAPLAAFEFDSGTLTLTEAGTQHRAQIHVLNAAPETAGLEPLEASAEAFGAALKSENHTLKRALTDPHVFSGIGNAYSDEILHAAQLSPVKLTQSLSDAEIIVGATVIVSNGSSISAHYFNGNMATPGVPWRESQSPLSPKRRSSSSKFI